MLALLFILEQASESLLVMYFISKKVLSARVYIYKIFMLLYINMSYITKMYS